MKRISKYILLFLCVIFMVGSISAAQKTKDTSTRKERDFIRSGNKLYNEKRYAEAEVEYKKALQSNPSSLIANFNLATSLVRQSGGTDAKAKNSPLKQATDIFTNITKTTKDANLLSKSYYNLGNIAYNQEQYQQSVDYYKNALRQNPNDDKARDNLRLAQLKLKNQDNKDKDKDKDKNKDKDKDKDKKDQNKDQNQNKDQQKNQQQQPQPQQGMSQDNIEQILKTMQNQENSTQHKVNAEKKQLNKRKTGNQW